MLSTGRIIKEFQIADIKNIIPKLSSSLHKGQCGRIGVIGGSSEYTGAPYFAAMTALRLGADIVHVFCSSAAGTAIKSYSPDLIVHPILDDDTVLKQLRMWLPRLHCVVFGPGLGREKISLYSDILDLLKQFGKPTVVDADGLYVISELPNLLKDFKNVILTPNASEFKRLLDSLTINNMPESEQLNSFFKSYRDVTLVKKGNNDEIINFKSYSCVTGGSVCRCGGQGDVLAGSIALFSCWADLAKSNDPLTLGAYSGCLFTKTLSSHVFKHYGRSMITNDFFPKIHNVFKDMFGEE
ncbi:ATP-dependent (S)-NAD(P)H-hydrate dehydratase [Hydra vulgaris]|uniref:ATP-dependent (S)-NAD(P)H-hydrate dehydratase n=1 Tax=Hydra vulgaris TaxID=6087 RepID=UPI0001925D95|nr:ATP-dependent (S)-NAD(P)H-hydrate dehydratase [Hydra vulgaris]